MTTASSTQHNPSSSRSSSLDLIKWLAMLTMVIDHLRLLWPDMSSLFIPGRLSFPFFCLAVAEFETYPLLALSTAFTAPLIGLWLLRQTFTFKVWPVQHWGYWFYPGHLVALQALRFLV
ncbi:TraX family protein [Pseudomonas sp. AL03]|uniref:TraX family protein n=1 Tax=Pseudomonas sp. AL03 TaxID=3042230 RepID=UPI00249AB7FE|nr:TraX family protein [Pseudomonas sp. AL03]MDI3273725.1 TraX family protein [Pseudomonas sp. AL03]